MRGFEEAIRDDMELEERMIKLIRKELKKLPEGKLKRGARGRSVYENQTHSLPPNGARALAIARRNLLETKLRIVQDNLKAQERLMRTYKSYRDDKVLERMSKVYQDIIGAAWRKDAQQRHEVRLASQQQILQVLQYELEPLIGTGK